MSVGFLPDPSSMHPVWTGSSRGDVFDKAQPLPISGSFHPEKHGPYDRYGLPYGGKPFGGDLDPAAHSLPGINGPEEMHLLGEQAGARTAIAREALLKMFPGKGEPSLEETEDLVVRDWRIGSDVPPVTWGLTPAPPIPPPVHPPSPPPAQPPGSPAGLHPLSAANQRVEELRVIFSALSDNISWGILDRLRPSGMALSQGWPALRPFAVEGVRLYRLLRAKLGDTREIPAEDR